jgi:sugar-specific transcriptional regulator TrmB
VRIYSGVPLLFKATAPKEVFEKIKEECGEFLDSVKSALKEEVREMKGKFVIKKFDIKLADIRSVSSDYE